MTARPAMRPDEIAAAAQSLRRSVRPLTAAGLLDCDRSRVYKLIKAGDLETHGLGKRGVRIYVDSIEAYRARKPGAKAPAVPEKPKTLGPEYYETCARLRALGLL